MADPRIEKWAEALTSYSVDVQPGMTVAVQGHLAGDALLRATAREVIRRGGYPVMIPIVEGVSTDLLTYGNDEQLSYITPLEEFTRTRADVSIMIMAETNTRRNSAVDPDRQKFFSSARSHLFETFMQRAADETAQWTLTLYPTDAYAQDADMDTEAYTDFVMHGCKLDQDDPVAAWKQLHDDQQRLIDWLDGKREIRMTGPDTDLTVNVAGRIWENSDGRKNFPSGEIFTGPVENSVNGKIRFSFPVVTAGRRIEDIRLTFVDGKVTDATAAKNEDYLIRTLDTDEGSRYLGEFAFGTNFDIQQFSSNILFDEKIGGTVHMAVGRGYPETGSKNVSAVHWDMICDLRQGGEILVDGQLFQKDGRFVI